MNNNRLFGLDYLRGFAAFIILLYHYLSWSGFDNLVDANTFIGRFGIYGVSIFYVLSGLTLFHVYFNKINPLSKENIKHFFVKRIFRIYPLLWLIIIITVVFKPNLYNAYTIIINLTGLYGYIDWGNYIAIGSWSIGNELVFYSFFPLFIGVFKSNKILLKYLLSFVILGMYIYFASFSLSSSQSLKEQWVEYANPLNQIFLFFSGFILGYFFQNIKFNNCTLFIILFLGIIIFSFYPSTSESISIVTNDKRYVFTLSCLLISLSLYKLNIQKITDSIFHKTLSFFGDISYSIYLIHPIVYSFVGLLIVKLNLEIQGIVYYKILISIIFSIIFSSLVFSYLEKYFIKIGNSVIYPN